MTYRLFYYCLAIALFGSCNALLISSLTTPQLPTTGETGLLITLYKKEFQHYFDNIFFVENASFIDDEHLKDPEVFTEKYKAEILR